MNKKLLSPGTKLGDCEIVKILGTGGMGVVYLAEHKVLALKVALKVLDSKINQDMDFLGRFYREARHTARLEHPNIVRIYGVFEENGLHYIIMNYIDGPSLETLVEKTILSEKNAISYVLQILAGLDYAHRENIIHRDIKPGNIMLNSKGIIKITDFGLVRNIKQEISITQPGVPIGTPVFMSPEQWENKGIDQRSDIFSVGVTLYNLLSQNYPYIGDTPITTYKAITHGRATPLRKYNSKVSAEVERMIRKAINPQKERRYQAAYNFAADLKKYLLKIANGNPKYLTVFPPDIFEADLAIINKVNRTTLMNKRTHNINKLRKPTHASKKGIRRAPQLLKENETKDLSQEDVKLVDDIDLNPQAVFVRHSKAGSTSKAPKLLKSIVQPVTHENKETSFLWSKAMMYSVLLIAGILVLILILILITGN